jgi:hypothetical protein
MSHYIHHLPGRLRIQSGRLRHSLCAQALHNLLADLNGITAHRHNPKAGSVLIEYNPDLINADDIIYYLSKSGCLESSVALRQPTYGNGVIKHAGMLFGNALFGTLMRKSVETSVLALAKGLR